jgi:3-oxoacyl-[acyl-carrier protein] reductase
MKEVFVTGAARGIGKAVAERFAEDGWDVVIHYNQSRERAEQLADKLGGETVQGDLSDDGDLEQLKTILVEDPPDVLVNNAGVAIGDEPGDPDSGEWQKTLDVNLTAASELARVTAEAMEEGAIVNVTSIRGLPHGARPGISAYCASKAGLESITKSLSQHFAPEVRINSVAPGFHDTEMNEDLPEDYRAEVEEDTPMGRFGKPEETADAVYFMASDQASFITGETLVVDGGLSIVD